MYIESLTQRLKCIVNELSPLTGSHCTLFIPYHSSVVQVLTVLPHLFAPLQLPAGANGILPLCLRAVKYFYCAFLENYIFAENQDDKFVAKFLAGCRLNRRERSVLIKLDTEERGTKCLYQSNSSHNSRSIFRCISKGLRALKQRRLRSIMSLRSTMSFCDWARTQISWRS
jgi:hypothetical protein